MEKMLEIILTMQSYDGAELPSPEQVIEALAQLGVCCGVIKTMSGETLELLDRRYVLNNYPAMSISTPLLVDRRQVDDDLVH